MGEPPQFKTVTELVTWMIASAFLLVLGVVAKHLMSARPSQPEQPPQTVAIATADGNTTTHEVRDTDPGMWAAVQDMAATQRATQRTLLEQSKQIAELRRDREALRNEQARDREYITLLDEHIEDMKAGVAEGRYPPFLPTPTRAGSMPTR